MVYFGQFSPRFGTAAAKMKDNVSKKEKVRRENYLNDILKKTALANNQKYLGQTLDVLVESKKDGFYFGRTRTMKNIKLPASKNNLIGKIVKVTINKANVWNLEGILN
jgi:tRNA-2-methylthio-N6-dimethylallyladenosine synthase